MTAVNKLLRVAQAEVGYLEKKSSAKLDDPTANAGSRNYTKYARDLDELGFYNGKKQGFAWCAVFVTWCFYQAFGLNAALALTCQTLGGLGAGVKYAAQYYKNKGRFVDKPQPGDQIFFFGGDGKSWAHTGLVEKVEGGRVYTIEGNTAGASGVVANGGGVCRKSYALTDKSIAGYGRPDWSLVPEEKPEKKEPWYAAAQRWAVDSGIADGTRPQEPATRAEVWTMMKRLKEGM